MATIFPVCLVLESCKTDRCRPKDGLPFLHIVLMTQKAEPGNGRMTKQQNGLYEVARYDSNYISLLYCRYLCRPITFLSAESVIASFERSGDPDVDSMIIGVLVEAELQEFEKQTQQEKEDAEALARAIELSKVASSSSVHPMYPNHKAWLHHVIRWSISRKKIQVPN